MPAAPITVVLADDHAVVRAGLRAVLGRAPNIQIIGEASTGSEAVPLCERLRPAVLVMDLSMPQLDGAGATKALQVKGIATRILILTMHSPDETLVPLLELGVAGFLHKSAADRELVDAVRAVARGETYLQPAAARVLAHGVRRRAQPSEARDKYDRLTGREHDVLLLVAQGFSSPAIGQRLAISPKTVDTYKQRIHVKLGLEHRPSYVQFALKLGLLRAE